MTIKTSLAKKRIATLWLILSGLLILIFLIFTFTDKFENKNQQAWGWMLSCIMPTLSLMFSIFMFDVKSVDTDNKEVDRFYYRITLGLSIAYLSLIFANIFICPFIEKSLMEMMTESNIVLAPFQGLVSASVGLFFYKKDQK